MADHSTFAKSIEKTRKSRRLVAKDLRPLFDHCVNLALDSHKHKRYTRAGIELKHARKLAGAR